MLPYTFMLLSNVSAGVILQFLDVELENLDKIVFRIKHNDVV